MAFVVQRRPGSKPGLLSRLFDSEAVKAANVHKTEPKPAKVSPEVHKKAGKVNAVASKATKRPTKKSAAKKARRAK